MLNSCSALKVSLHMMNVRNGQLFYSQLFLLLSVSSLHVRDGVVEEIVGFVFKLHRTCLHVAAAENNALVTG